MTNKGFMMVGERRSGTNLLRLILSQNKDVVSPHFPLLLHRMLPLSQFYGQPYEPEIFKQMVNDVCYLIDLDPVDWHGPELSHETITKRCKHKSFFGIVSAILELCVDFHGGKLWLYKEPEALKWASEIDEHFNSPRYIFLYRDPRDVVLSFANSTEYSHKHPYFLAKQWVEIQKLCINALHRNGERLIHSIRYEDLLLSPLEALTPLCSFMGIPFETKMLEFHQSDTAKAQSARGHMWKRLSAPLDRNNTNKYVSEMSEDSIRIVESIAGEIMDYLHYPRVLIPSGSEDRYSSSDIARFKEDNERLQQESLDRLSQDSWERKRPQMAFIEMIQSRAQSLSED